MLKKNIGLILVLLITLVIYFPAFFYHFVGDDYIALTKIVTSSSLSKVFQFHWQVAGNCYYFRPLQWLPFLIGYSLTGLPLPPEPAWQAGHFLFAYHLIVIALHLGNVFLVYLIAAFLFKSSIQRALAALIFAVHPINADVACGVVTISEASFTFFSLFSLVLFTKFYLGERKIPPLLYYLGSCLSFVLAFCAKESALILPLIIILTIIFLKQRQDIPNAKAKRFSWSVYFVIMGLYFILRKLILPPSGLPWRDFIIKSPRELYRLIYCLRDLIFPVDLFPLKRFVYQYRLFPLFIGLAFFFISLFICILLYKFRKNRILLFSLLWIAITLSIPAFASFIPEKRHVYFPLVGYSIFLVSFAFLIKKKPLAIFLLSLFIILEIRTSLARNDLYRITGEVVQKGLSDLKKELPALEPDSIVCLVGIPGTAKGTFAFWGETYSIMKFLYKNRNLDVLCLSLITFTEKSIKDSDVIFLDDFTLIQSMATNFDEFIRVTGEKEKGQLSGFNTQNVRFEVLKRDKFGHVEKVKFHLDPQFLKGRKVYFIGLKNARVGVLRVKP